MAITYPLSIPDTGQIRTVAWSVVDVVAVSRSPFTYDETVFSWPGAQWEAVVTLVPMRYQSAAQWVAWLMSLRGMEGTFLLGDPLHRVPRGLAATLPGLPTASAISSDGRSLSITGAPGSKQGWLLPGDKMQMGTGSAARVYTVLEQVDTDASGAATFDIWPPRESVAGEAVVLTDPAGVFRLASNQRDWSVSNAAQYGISFAARSVTT